MTAEQIAEKLEIVAPGTVFSWMPEKELVARYERSKVPTSIEQFDTEEEKALQLLANIHAKKQAAIEAKKLPGVLKPQAHLVAFFLEEDALPFQQGRSFHYGACRMTKCKLLKPKRQAAQGEA